MNGFTHVGLIHCQCIRTLSQAALVASLCSCRLCGVRRFIESTSNNVIKSWGNEQPRTLSIVFHSSLYIVTSCATYLAAIEMYGMKATTFCITYTYMLFDEVSVAHNITFTTSLLFFSFSVFTQHHYFTVLQRPVTFSQRWWYSLTTTSTYCVYWRGIPQLRDAPSDSL